MNANHTARTFASELLAAQKQVFEWQAAQARIADTQTRAWMDATRNGVELTQKAWLDMGRVMLDTLLPAETPKA